jgi:chemotaxis protein MotB
MAKKHKHEEHVNHERWLISYADFITLLFAFFVVMYSVSSVNEGKYKVMSDSLQAAFEGSPKSLTPIQVGTVEKSYRNAQSIIDNNSQASEDAGANKKSNADDALAEISSALKDTVKVQIDQKEIKIKEDANWVEIELKTASLFQVGSATLSNNAGKILEPIYKILSKYNNPIQVEGFTDNVYISNDVFPSNWELSSSRAAAVVRRLISLGIFADRLAAVGYAENFPIADNNDPDGRRENRRVVIVITKSDRRSRLLQGQYAPPGILEQIDAGIEKAVKNH